MQRRVTLATLATLAALAATTTTTIDAQVSPLPPRDRPQAPLVGTAAIKGRVVDGQSGTAVARARVRLNGPAQRPPVLTDASGAFTFTALPAGSYSVTADKSTYLPARYPESGQTLRTSNRPLILADGQVVEDAKVALFRGSVISGRVLDANGDLLENADVRVMRLTRSGRGRPQMRGGGGTNDIGEFRVSRLEPGKYLLLVIPRRYGPSDEPVADTKPVPTYYPGVLSIDQAVPIAVERGTSVAGLDVMVIDSVATVVSGTVVDSTGQPVTRNVSVMARAVVKDAAGGFDGGPLGNASVKPDGTFQMKLAPGEYQLDAQGMRPGVMGPPQPGDQQFGSARLAVGGEVTGVTIVLGAGARISGRLVFEGARQPPPAPTNPNSGPLRVAFTSTNNSACRTGRSELATDWTFTVDGVWGTCLARFNGAVPPWTVKAIVHDGKDLMDQPTTFESGQQLRDVEVLLTNKRTELTLQVADEHGTATREYVALLFSVDKTRWVDNTRFFRTYVPQPEPMMGSYGSVGARTASMTMVNGTMVSVSGGLVGGSSASGGVVAAPGGSTARREMIAGMPAGDYYVVALDDIDGETARDPEMLEYLSRGATRVSAVEGVPLQVSLRRIKRPDPSQGR